MRSANLCKDCGETDNCSLDPEINNRGVLAFQGIIDSEHCCETLAIVAIVLRKSSLTQHKLMITPKIVHLINQPQGNMAITAVKRLTHYYIEKLDKRIKQTVVQIHLNMALQ